MAVILIEMFYILIRLDVSGCMHLPKSIKLCTLNMCISIFVVALFIIPPNWKSPKCSSTR